jgi:predicted dehydrogenase
MNQGKSRRQFLGRLAFAAAAGCTAPMFVPATALGAGDRPSASNRITIGFIGTGRQAIYANIPGFLREPDAQCVAVCDVDSWRMELARKNIESYYAEKTASGLYRGCAVFRDWRELLNRKDIDAVMISTPDHWHVLIALAALRAGKDVACEKPLTRNIAEGRKLSDTVTATRRVFRTDSEFRSNKSFYRVAQLARNGKLGRLARIIVGLPKDPTLPQQPAMPVPEELDYEMWLGPAPAAPYTLQRVHPRHDARGRPGWLCIRDYADGMLANWGAHLNDIALWAADLEHTGPVEIQAKGKYPPKENLWNVFLEIEAEFKFANGLQLICKSDKPFLRIEGSEGWIQVKYPTETEAEPESLLKWQPGPNDLILPYKSSEKRDFLDAVKARTTPLYDAEAGHRNTSLSHLALASMELGRKLKWDPSREIVLNDEEANRLLQPRPMRQPWKL